VPQTLEQIFIYILKFWPLLYANGQEAFSFRGRSPSDWWH